MAPSAATREAALEAFAPLLMRSSSSAFLMSAPASSSAFLHSIMPSPVRSRSSLTIAAVISAIFDSLQSRHSREGGNPGWAPVYTGATKLRYKKGARSPLFRRALRENPEFHKNRLLHFFLFLDLDEVLGALRRHELADDLAAALEDRVGDAPRIEADGARRIVVAGDHVVDPVQRLVGVDHAHDRDAERLRLGDRDLVEAHVDHEERVGDAAHVLDAAERTLELLALAHVQQLLLLRQALAGAVRDHRVHLLQALDRALHRLEVGEHAAQPAIVDVGRAGALGFFLHDLARLALGADEEDLPLVRGELAHVLESVLVHREALLEVDDVDLVAGPEDVRSHLGIPVARLVAEVNAGLQHLAHGNGHAITPWLRLASPAT